MLLLGNDGKEQLLAPLHGTLLQGELGEPECTEAIETIPDPFKRAATTNSQSSSFGLSNAVFIINSPFILFKYL
jgi:hypothetical protein